MGRPTGAEITKRVLAVMDMIVNGQSRAEILQFVAETYNSSERTADNYIAKAREMLAVQFEREVELNTQIALARLNTLFYECVKVQDYKAALAVVREQSKLLGLNAPEKQDITSGGAPLRMYGNVTPDEWDGDDDGE